jgi:type I restriction enzyme S subunit
MFWIQQNRTEFESRSAGSTFKEISKSNVKSIKLSLPPLSEQKRIVHLISSVDFYIEALQQMVESVKETRKALLQELFTAGGDNWIETTIGDISRFISMRNAPDQLSTDSIYVGLEHLEPNITSINNFAFTSKVTSSLTPFEVGDVLFGRLRPYLHKVALAEIKGFCSPEILVLRANSKVLPQMLLLYCDADSTIKICVEKSAGTRMPRTSSDDLASIKVMLPSMPQQELIADLFGTFDANIARVNVSLEKTRVLRSGLLSDLLSGEHEIPTSYDKVMEAV